MNFRLTLLIFALSLFSLACSTAQEKKNTTTAPVEKVESKTTSNQQAQIQKLREAQKNKVPSGVKLAKSRPKDQINAAYPFDIDLKDATGKVVKSTDVFTNDKPTVLMFWLTTCAPCHRKMNELVKVYDSMKEEADFNLFAISGDFEKNYPSFVSQVEKKNWPWPTYNDMNREFRMILPGDLNGYPQTFVFDKEGEIVYRKKKYLTGDLDKLTDVLKKL